MCSTSENTVAKVCLHTGEVDEQCDNLFRCPSMVDSCTSFRLTRAVDILTCFSCSWLTRTTPSECPVTMTFCVSHSFISDTQQQTICWLLPVNVFTLTIGFPLMLHTWIYVPAQDTMSPWEGREKLFTHFVLHSSFRSKLNPWPGSQGERLGNF